MSHETFVFDPVAENRELRARLEAAEEMLRAIRANEVDALVVGLAGHERVYSLGSADEAYRTFVEVMVQGAVTVSGDGTILYCNRHFAELTGSSADLPVGASIYDFATPEDEGLLRALLWEALSGGSVKRQFYLRSRDGKRVPAALSATPLTVGGMTCACLLVNDLTEHEARVAAEAAGAAKDRFLALLSHELRTPLTPVLIAVSDMESDETLPEGVRENLAMIRRNVELETRLIDDLLDLSRVISGKLRLHLKPVRVAPLLRTVVEMLRNDLDQKKLRLECHLSDAIDEISGDSARLQQVFWNLLRNAIKFSREGARITVRCRHSQRTLVQVEVSDDGAGIDPSVLPRIFEAFEQGGGEPLQHGGGLGLGLTIAKTIVEAHGGTITARSEGLGRGACFVVTLPLAPAGNSQQGKIPAPSTPNPAPTPVRVLLVEDHHDTSVALAKVLGHSGHEVRIARSIAAALDHASKESFDLVISDIGLPDGTGYELMKQIHQRHAIPGIALTGYGMESDVQLSSQAGFAEHVVKPVELAHLQRVIARVVAEHRSC